MRFEDHILTERLPDVFGSRQTRRYPSDRKPGRLGSRSIPVTGPSGWWDLSKSASVTLTSRRVSAVADLSGNAATLSEGSSSEAADYLIPVVDASGLARARVNPKYYTASVSASIRTQSLFIAGTITSLSANVCLFGSDLDGGRVFRFEASSGRLRFTKRFVADLQLSSSGMAVSVNTPFVAGMIMSATDVTFRLNHVTAETFSDSTTFTTGRATILGGGDGGGSTTEYRGDIYEAIMFDSALSSGNADLMVDYLMSKWGIS